MALMMMMMMMMELFLLMGMVMMIMMMMTTMTGVSSSSVAYPEGFGSDIYEVVSMASPACPPRNLNLNKDEKEKVKKRVMDISHAYRADLPTWESPHGLGLPITQVASIANGSIANESSMKMGVHSGTHVDAPSHIFQKYLEAGYNVDTLDLDVLNGPALIVDAPRDSNLTAESLQALKLPCGVERVLFRTLNTDRRLMWKKEFDTSYVGFTTEGAQWLKENTQIKLVGVDYLSVAAFDSLIPAHVVLLQHRDIILVEGLNLDDVDAGLFNLHCLPLRILNSDGSPIRCVVE